MDPNERINDQTEAFLALKDALQGEMWTSHVGIVISWNPAENSCSVQLAIQDVQTQPDGTGKLVTITPLIHCPVLFQRGGGFTATFPIKAGDECTVFFAKSCVDAWWERGGVQVPAEFRAHDISDGFVLVGPMSKPNVITNISTTAAQLRKDTGETYVEVGDQEITLTPDNLTTSVKVTPGLVAIVAADVTVNGESLVHHVHGGITPGSGDTAEWQCDIARYRRLGI